MDEYNIYHGKASMDGLERLTKHASLMTFMDALFEPENVTYSRKK